MCVYIDICTQTDRHTRICIHKRDPMRRDIVFQQHDIQQDVRTHLKAQNEFSAMESERPACFFSFFFFF
eukprot:NODE_3072_length_709_cov_100.765152_g1741_i2.p3 GENE.NODE_3072_length_709_cov_100.765152_g1741_i2~~NODE_3072_length_709_cov_100.765152_g1741_i2.p3  ORF type:complete len:69 (-),score=8.33 NODE_3072_length_709_cov_100.765152_g1741_i2:19-225(-)